MSDGHEALDRLAAISEEADMYADDVTETRLRRTNTASDFDYTDPGRGLGEPDRYLHINSGAAEFNPIAPGETLRDTLDALGMSQRDLADRTGMSAKTANQIVQGVAPITHDTALKLERATGVPARMWNNLEAEYREQLARARQDEHLAEQVD